MSKEKIGIITINDYDNYGNRLQCYAVQEFFKGFNLEVENIVNYKRNFKKTIKRFIKIIINYKNQMALEKRFTEFKQFNRNIKFSKYKIVNGRYNRNLVREYNNFFVGSDQVWNPYFAGQDEDFLTFAKDKMKNAFSASFGVSELPQKDIERYRKYLRGFNNISVREDTGKVIIEKLLGRTDVEVLVDPTMLLSSVEWDKVIRKPKQLNNLKSDKYILNYFLGKIPNEWEKEINRIASENNCEIINILDKNNPFYQTGPSEFLYLEKNAFLVCTDSFHSSVFSIIFDTPFVIFERNDKWVSMNSRIDTLLSKFNLQNKRFNGDITQKMLECDYTEAKIILEKEKEKSINFLKKALDINNE